jgi:hypothetical protein
VVIGHAARYKEARNELLKTAVRTERQMALQKALPNLTVRGWIGTLKKMGTTSDGQAYVEIQLGDAPCIVENLSPDIADIGKGTLITQGTPLYTQLAALTEGAKVKFDGEFFESNRDWIKELSIREQGGMEKPEFLINFSSITPLR